MAGAEFGTVECSWESLPYAGAACLQECQWKTELATRRNLAKACLEEALGVLAEVGHHFPNTVTKQKHCAPQLAWKKPLARLLK